MKTLINGNL